MPRKPKGSLSGDGTPWIARITLDGRRPRFELPTFGPGERGGAEARCEQLAVLAKQLTEAGHASLALPLLERAAAADERVLPVVLEAARRLCSGQAIGPLARTDMTFRDFGKQWTSGALHRRWPDQVRKKKSAKDDRQRFEKHVYPIVGDVLVIEFSLDHADAVMASLPSSLSQASRRQVAQAMNRLLSLAVYPARVIERNPLPRGFLPKLGARKALSFLYPQEDAQLMAATHIPLEQRIFWGVLAREGMRFGEATAMVWSDLDLLRGAVRLDENKTDDPRAWALDPGVVRALARYEQLLQPGDELVFTDPDGRSFSEDQHVAQTFRDALQAAGVRRPELFERSSRRLPIRVHDLRATFITLALANGKTETWVADRTGHRSSVMINRYRRAARRVSELGLGTLIPLDEAIPELRPRRGNGQETATGSAAASGSKRVSRRLPNHVALVAEAGLEPALPRKADFESGWWRRERQRPAGSWGFQGARCARSGRRGRFRGPFGRFRDPPTAADCDAGHRCGRGDAGRGSGGGEGRQRGGGEAAGVG
ncbi:MAG: DNA integration/recombination/inversion protein [Sandaracinus sp.]|nr:DNA integration/recombination/inversion protein [Sandaracinus sp.]